MQVSALGGSALCALKLLPALFDSLFEPRVPVVSEEGRVAVRGMGRLEVLKVLGDESAFRRQTCCREGLDNEGNIAEEGGQADVGGNVDMRVCMCARRGAASGAAAMVRCGRGGAGRSIGIDVGGVAERARTHPASDGTRHEAGRAQCRC